jgi:ribonucleoside-diphosphate reductase beta chain
MDAEEYAIAKFMGFDDELTDSRTYNFFQQAMDGFWNPTDIDLAQDREDWAELTEDQRETILEYTSNFIIGEQRVAEEIPPLVFAAYRLGRFDWVAHLTAFQLEEVKHAQFFQYWLQTVYGTVDPEELAPHLHMDKQTVEKHGKYDDPTWLAVTALPEVMEELLERAMGDDRQALEEKFVEALTIYCAHQEGIAGQVSYRVVLDTCEQWGDILPGLQQGYHHILQDEGRHVGGGTTIIREMLEENPEYEEIVRDVIEGNKESLIGFISYQLANPDLDLQQYQELKARQYRQRCKEMGIEVNETLAEEIRDPDAQFVRV